MSCVLCLRCVALWEIFRDFIAAVAEHVSCAMWEHALWEIFRDFVAAVAGIM